MATLAELVRHYRSERQLSQEGLAERAGVSTRTVSDIECGVARTPRAVTLSLLLEALDLDEEARTVVRTAARPVREPRAASVTDAEVSLAPTSLPAGPPRLLGRERQLAAVAGLLRRDDVRLVSIVGAGGIGKTSLALHAAREVASAYDRVVFVDLSAVTDAKALPSAVVAGAGLREVPDEQSVDAVARAFGTKRTLLFLDTFELVVAAARFVSRLLDAMPALHVLVTSRVPLRVALEQEFPLDALSAQATVDLIVERARAVRPQFALTDASRGAVVTLARLLEGNPLAVELAVPLLKVMSPAALAARLDRRLPLLVDGRSDLPERQRTMRDALAWSYALLAPSERRVFRVLSVLRSSFTAPDALAIAGIDEGPLDMLRTLAALVDQHLLYVVDDEADEPRFAFTDLVREYADEMLADGVEREAAFERLVDHLTGLGVQFKSSGRETERAVARTLLAAQAANVDAALRWSLERGRIDAGLRLATALWDYWWFTGAYESSTAWLSELLAAAEASGGVDEALLAHAYMAACGLSAARGDYEVSDELREKAVPIKRKLGDQLGLAALISGSAVAASERGDYERARKLFEEGLEIRRQYGDAFVIGKSLCDLGSCEAATGDSVAAATHLEEALANFRRAGSELGIGIVFHTLGRIALREGLADRAETLSAESLRIGRMLGHESLAASALAQIACARLLRGRVDEALQQLREALHQFEAMGDLGAGCDVLDGYAHALMAAGEAREATRIAARSEALRRKRRGRLPPVDRARHEELLAGLRARLGDDAYEAEWAVGAGAVDALP